MKKKPAEPTRRKRARKDRPAIGYAVEYKAHPVRLAEYDFFKKAPPMPTQFSEIIIRVDADLRIVDCRDDRRDYAVSEIVLKDTKGRIAFRTRAAK
jgi:hypothetical protein